MNMDVHDTREWEIYGRRTGSPATHIIQRTNRTTKVKGREASTPDADPQRRETTVLACHQDKRPVVGREDHAQMRNINFKLFLGNEEEHGRIKARTSAGRTPRR
jgi:hypothetical protein